MAVVALFLILAPEVLRYLKANRESAVEVRQGNGRNQGGSGDEGADAGDSTAEALHRLPDELRVPVERYAGLSEDIARSLREGWEEKLNVGGAIAVAVTNWQFNGDKWAFSTPEQLGFSKITEENSLVNCARNKLVKIKAVNLIWHRGEEDRFEVSVEAASLSDSPVRCVIPRGQVFELKGKYLSQKVKNEWSAKHDGPQGLMRPERDKDWDIPPSGDVITMKAYCFNRGLFQPDGPGNITIYRLADTRPEVFETQDALQAHMEAINGGERSN
jgi:hypothetical protein